jgi:hypothetical protein
MELSPETIEHLRDEAYLFLCREAVQGRLDELAREKATIASTRPPFFLLSKKETRDAFTQSMRAVSDNEVALRDQLSQIARLDEWLRPAIREEVVAYLNAASPDFRAFSEIRGLLQTWESFLPGLSELLVALARELRTLRTEAAAGRGILQSLAGLREVVMGVEEALARCNQIGTALSGLTGNDEDVARDIRLPALPEFRREGWVNRLALMPAEQVVAEASRAETEARAFLSGGNEAALARLEASRSACGMFENAFAEHYWMQLRTHARIHYVEERDIDEVLDMLSQRYVNAQILREQQVLSRDPFLTER